MIDLKHLRENQDFYKKGFVIKQAKVDIPNVLKLDENYRELLQKVEEYRAEKNKVSKLIPTLSEKERQGKIDEMKENSDDFKKIGKAYQKAGGTLQIGKVGIARAILIPQRELVDFAAQWMTKNRK